MNDWELKVIILDGDAYEIIVEDGRPIKARIDYCRIHQRASLVDWVTLPTETQIKLEHRMMME